jgi:competence protein ComEC
MHSWIPYAFVRIVVFFAAGILTGICYPDVLEEKKLLLLILFGGAFFFLILLVNHYYKRQRINPGFTGLMVVFFLGYADTILQTEQRSLKHVTHESSPILYYKVVLTKYAEERDSFWKQEGRIQAVKTAAGWHEREGSVLLYFKKPGHSFQYGDVLMVKGTPQEIPPPANPGEFNYKRYLSYLKIYHQQFIGPGDVLRISNEPPSIFIATAIRVRAYCDHLIKEYVHGEQQQSIASALVLGITEGLDPDLLKAYSGTGALHILAVSGLHVGIIYALLVLLLAPLKKSSVGQWVLAVISLLLLWLYAFVTGWSPSVLRAVTMFSFVAIAQPLQRRINIYNIMAVSAFVLLFYEPYFITSVGFQLSYLAVLGIVYLHPKLYPLYTPASRWKDELWKLISVSIAAQAATFGISLLYFHQFPNFFLLANLIAIPLSFIVLVAGLALLAFSFIPWVAIALGWILKVSIQIMNFAVFTIDRLPFSKTVDIHINSIQVILIILSTLVFTALVEHKRFVYVKMLVVLMIAFTGIDWYIHLEALHQKRIIVYDIKGHSSFDAMAYGTAYTYLDSTLLSQNNKIARHILPARFTYHVSSIKDISALTKKVTGASLTIWQGQSILVIRDKHFQPPPLSVDILIIANNSIQEPQYLFDNLSAKQIILDSSNTSSYCRWFLREARRKGIVVHSVLDQQAFEQIIT